jgi:hypothetical protein
MQGSEVFTWAQIPETHQERQEMLKGAMTCDECRGMGRPAYFGALEVYRMKFDQFDRNPICCARCKETTDANGSEATKSAIEGPLTAEQVLDHLGILMSATTGDVFIPEAVIAQIARVRVPREEWAAGERLAFSDAMLVLQGLDMYQRLGKMPFPNVSSFMGSPVPYEPEYTPQMLGLRRRSKFAPDVMDPSWGKIK